MSFRLQRLDARLVDHPLHEDRAIVSSLGRHEYSRYLVVTVEDGDGVRGHGEATTAPVWSGERAETALGMAERFIAPLVVGPRFDHPREALDRIDRMLFGNPFLKAAVDIAIWDLWARRQDVSVSSLIADREPAASVPTRASVGCYPVDETVRLAEAFWRAGVRTLKFKTGVPGISDVDRLRAVRERLGPEPVFTVDANGAHRSADEAVAAIEPLLPFRLALVEQPTPRDRYRMMAEVRRRLPVPILADELVFTPDHLAEALEADAFDLLSIYPGKNGGFTRSLDMARTAQAAGKRCVIGSNLETDLGQAAMICLASSLSAFPVETHACDLMASLFYRESATIPPMRMRDGRVEIPKGPGFGVEPAAQTEAGPYDPQITQMSQIDFKTGPYLSRK